MSEPRTGQIVSRSGAPERPRPSSAPRRPRSGRGDADPSFDLVLHVLARWWRVLLPVTLVLLVVANSIVFYVFRPRYRAAAWLQVKSQQPYVAFREQEVADREDARKYVQTQMELMRSPLVLARALGQPEIARTPELARRRDPVDWLARQGLEITPKGDSELLEVAFAGIDPQASAQLVNGVVNAYFSIRDEKNGAQVQAVILLLENERARRAEEIKLLQSEVRQLQAQLVQRDPARASNSLQATEIVVSENPLQQVREGLAQAEIQGKVLESQARALEESLQSPPEVPTVLVDRELNQRREIQELEAQLNDKKALLQQVGLALAKPGTDQRYQRLESDIRQLENKLASLRDVNRPAVRREMEALSNLERQRQLEALRTQLASQQLIVQNMRGNYDSLVKELSLSGGQALDLRLKQRELERRQEVFDRISDRAAQLATEAYAPRRVDPIQDATPPPMPMEALPWRQLLLATLGSLAIPLGAVALWERSVRRVMSVDQLLGDVSLPVIGEIARLPRRNEASEGLDDLGNYELSLFEESVDSLRTGLVLAHERERIQVLAISSAVSGEGKSSVASQLAVSLARSSGLPTLLIDGDMRSPDLHRIFKIGLEPGLADVLAGGEKLAGCINRSWSEQVHILPAGRLRKNPHKLVGGDRLQAVLEWARRHYHFIVIDTPPVLAASEAMVMARLADGALICAMRDVSRESHVRMTCERLLSVGARPLGTVLSGVPTRTYARRYGSYGYTRKPGGPARDSAAN